LPDQRIWREKVGFPRENKIHSNTRKMFPGKEIASSNEDVPHVHEFYKKKKRAVVVAST
jgi:hypothetical protein